MLSTLHSINPSLIQPNTISHFAERTMILKLP